MDKKAMKTLAVHNWVVAKKAYQKYQNQANLANGHTTKPHPTSAVKLSKAEREANLVLGLAKLAHRCHVSFRILFPPGVADEKGVQDVWTYIEAYANDGAYSIHWSSAIPLFRH
jgi:hypothetical protein